ncbi:hypothetical protein K432DRAFT_344745 [Lepidopterella palustris CBS 459.81]|uniref:Uncharacterized protein n=1 Tax=Lepidopterella palustris CBS 459.81 TaxID=1314670 RepID=A0A8E2EIY4_9PEZI|nr:hypothetical protein K432DRAFT_344745 [Lepidopterella palustris CBS 459.81]
MPKVILPKVIPPAEKLPLAIRKNVRDEYDANHADLEEQISKLLGTTWKIDINPNAIWVYATDRYRTEELGGCLTSYVNGAIENIESFLKIYGDIGKDEINAACSAHTLTLAMDESGKIVYSGCDISDGKLRMLFHHENLAANTYRVLENLEDALSAVNTRPGLCFLARHSIAEDWDANVEDLQNRIATQLANDTIVLTPNFEEVYAAIKAANIVQPNDRKWEKHIGSDVIEYFEGFLSSLEDHKFGSDEMLQEGFAEVVTKNEIKFRIVKKLVSRTWNESVIEDGVFYMQTVPEYFPGNVREIADNIVDLL